MQHTPVRSQIPPLGPIFCSVNRFICRRDGDRVRVFSRRGNDYTDRVPAIAEALAALRVKSGLRGFYSITSSARARSE
jgi:hypothetical protein